MKITPINTININNCRKPTSSVNKLNQKVFLKNNGCDFVLFTGVKENKEGIVPLSYKKETRGAYSISHDTPKLLKETKELLSEIDGRANTLIDETNEINIRAEKYKKQILDIFNSNKNNAEKGGAVLSNGETSKVFAVDDRRLLIGEIKDNSVISVHEVKDGYRRTMNEYTFNPENGQLTEYRSYDGKNADSFVFEPDKITAVNSYRSERTEALICMDEDDKITTARFKEIVGEYSRTIQKTDSLSEGIKGAVVSEISNDENASADWICYYN